MKGYLINTCANKQCVNPQHLRGRDEYFNSLISKNNLTECWEWIGIIKGGYGFFYIDGKQRLVHRYMYEKYIKPIPPGQYVCHRCDNPCCVNPAHLWLGSQHENMKDMKQKKRDKKSHGEEHHNSKITSTDALIIKTMLKDGLSMRDIHRRLNISYRIIQHIKLGDTWNHIKLCRH